MRKFIIAALIVIVIGFAGWKLFPNFSTPGIFKPEKTPSPLDATYLIDGQNVTLVAGKAQSSVAPGSASMLQTSVFGQPSYGDLNGDGTLDAVMFVTQEGGGSGTFFYAVVALDIDGRYEGLGSVSLGDRIAPQSILIKNQTAMVNYAERKEGEPMTAAPSVGVTKYVIVNDHSIKFFNLLSPGEQLFNGNMVMASEVRIFTPCGGTAHWVIGTSTAYSELMKAYATNKSTTSPYSSVYAVVSGVIVPPPTDGFGADYNFGIDVKNLIKVIPGGSCTKN